MILMKAARETIVQILCEAPKMGALQHYNGKETLLRIVNELRHVERALVRALSQHELSVASDRGKTLVGHAQ